MKHLFVKHHSAPAFRALITLSMLWTVPFITGCNSLFYFPSRHIFSTPDQVGLLYEPVTFRHEGGPQLSGWFIPAFDTTEPAQGTVVQIHGNAENMTSHWFSLAWMPFSRFNLFTFDYRGYGDSEGIPEIEGTIQDVKSAIAYVQSRTDVDKTRLIVIGQSLGGALSIAALAQPSEIKVPMLIVENTFSSYQRIAREKLQESWILWHWHLWAPDLLIDDTYSPESLISKIHDIPILFIHGTNDQVISYHHSLILYEKANVPKYLWILPQGQHLSTFHTANNRKNLLDFIQTKLPQTDKPKSLPLVTHDFVWEPQTR
ncbi:MAG: alpha/beta hydrolase [SAR324 cluster bacterium]|nr:alpha/beta hydrolase [SAR324 cluster bacterium]